MAACKSKCFNKVNLVHIPGSSMTPPARDGPTGKMDSSFRWPTSQSLAPEWRFTEGALLFNLFFHLQKSAVHRPYVPQVYPSIHGQPILLSSGERWVTSWMSHQLIIGPKDREKHPFTLTFIPEVSVESPVHLSPQCLWTVGGSRSTRRELTQTLGGTWKLHTKKLLTPRKILTFLLWSSITTVTPLMPAHVSKYIIFWNTWIFLFDTCYSKGIYKIVLCFMLN